jgi:hypothetical protein
MFCHKDKECIKGLIKLRNNPIKKTTEKNNLEKFIKVTKMYLNSYTKHWDMNWEEKVDNNMNKVSFHSYLKWPMHHILPFDLIPNLTKLIKKLGGVQVKKVKFKKTPTRDTKIDILIFKCHCAFDDEFYVKCENCGNIWDGNAQCMCFLDTV